MAEEFTDYYEILELSPNANSGTLERMFRYLAQRYHPDNRETGDRIRFDLVVEAHTTLKDPVKRAHYDVLYKDHSDFRWKLAEEADDGVRVDQDAELQMKVLSIFTPSADGKFRNPGLATSSSNAC